MPFYVYILQNSEGRLYIGQTSNLELRLYRHNQGKVFWTKTRGPWAVVHSEEFSTRAEAIRQEKSLKALKSKALLQGLIAQRQTPDSDL